MWRMSIGYTAYHDLSVIGDKAEEKTTGFRDRHTHARCLRLWRPSLSVISAAFIAFCNLMSIPCFIQSDGWSSKPYRQILLIGKDQEQSIPQLIFVQHTLQLLTSLYHTVTIVAVNNKDDTLGILEVVPPKRPDLVLSTDIPYGKLDVLVLDRLNIEAFGDFGCVSLDTIWNSRSSDMGLYEPMVGIVVTISPSLSLYRIVVLPAASRPTIKILISLLPHSLSNNFEKVRPMTRVGCRLQRWCYGSSSARKRDEGVRGYKGSCKHHVLKRNRKHAWLRSVSSAMIWLCMCNLCACYDTPSCASPTAFWWSWT